MGVHGCTILVHSLAGTYIAQTSISLHHMGMNLRTYNKLATKCLKSVYPFRVGGSRSVQTTIMYSLYVAMDR